MQGVNEVELTTLIENGTASKVVVEGVIKVRVLPSFR